MTREIEEARQRLETARLQWDQSAADLRYITRHYQTRYGDLWMVEGYQSIHAAQKLELQKRHSFQTALQAFADIVYQHIAC